MKLKIIENVLGNFGLSLTKYLADMGHEVIAVDKRMHKVEMVKDKVTHAISMDTTDINAVKALPVADADYVVVTIGEEEGASILTTALMKEMGVKNLISRAISPLEETVLKAMGVKEIIHPEDDSALRLAKRLSMKGVVDSFELDNNHNIIEVMVPHQFIGRRLADLKLRNLYDILVLTILKRKKIKNILGVVRETRESCGVASADSILENGDILVIFGNVKDIGRMMNDVKD